ncbi:MAG: hypothetical protein OXN84_08680 [Albidovulum sp.]|nr:hypothetical protein [Albidovulum sp.]
MFEIDPSKSSVWKIQFRNYPRNIRTVAIAKGCRKIADIVDARKFDGSSRIRRPNIGQVAVLQNENGYWAAIKVLGIRDDTRSDDHDEVSFDYVIMTNGSPGFVR